ncbi:hypothetical protein HII31_03484 [Pseudocercospora fuligena]|uniref:Uncharacterized protein n=1 Tax=Pseudocercospora fuligena TaxID=685502 RepID=A0A8H6RQW9_9PEZI|nr:hypothetical protein HII31_03484 [Pseudocercospora fuligena]
MDEMSSGLILVRSLFGDPKPADGPYTPARVPPAAKITSMVLNLITLPVLGACLTRRLERIQKWNRIPLSALLLLIIYVDSFLFIFTTALIKHIGINRSEGLCDGAILLCLVCYMSTKVLIYTFLVEKAWIVRGCLKRRIESRLYLFNCFGMLLPYAIAVVLNFIWRISFIDTKGKCIIGMEKRAMMPLIIFEVVVNAYLNILFIIPLRKMYSYRHGTGRMRNLALRTFVGSCATLTSSVVNLTVLMAVGGEPGWLCLMLCNADILFCVLVLHWATSFDSGGYTPNNSACSCSRNSRVGAVPIPVTPYPEPALQRRRNPFRVFSCEEEFPEGCWKAHPWDVSKDQDPVSKNTSESPSKLEVIDAKDSVTETSSENRTDDDEIQVAPRRPT